MLISAQFGRMKVRSHLLAAAVAILGLNEGKHGDANVLADDTYEVLSTSYMLDHIRRFCLEKADETHVTGSPFCFHQVIWQV